MCGIAGFLVTQRRPEDRDVLVRMTELLRHRGPDESGVYTDAQAFLGHRRLSIIDLATGQQPMSNEDGSAWITYNGEIFNHASLRPELEASHRYKSSCDTETILHAYEQFGPACLQRFRGMFAFAIWDAARKTLFCARDRLGIKPFYYYFDGRLFAFASEIKALFEHPAIRPQLEEDALAEYLAFGYLSGEQTLFRGIRKLMPGHHMTLRVGDREIERRVEQYWDVPLTGESEPQSEDSWIRECRTRLEETVQMRLMSDVPLGVFLSGGVDSSAIAALMRRMVSEPIKTFSVGYREDQYSELGYARQAASHIGSQHHEVLVGMEEFFNKLPELIWHEDEPIVWPSSVSLYFVSELASQHVKVVLTGEGCDELFAGYGRYAYYLLNRRWLPYYEKLPGQLRLWLRRQIAGTRGLSANLRRKLQHTVLGLGGELNSLLLDNFYCAFPGAELAKLIRRSPGPVYENYQRYWNSANGAPVLQRLLYTDQKTYLVELLMKQDQMSMASSIESRVPLLDHTFVEFAARVPEDLKLRRTGKYIFKKSVEDILPHEIIYRKKMGFPTPLRQWLVNARAKPLYDLLRDPDGILAAHLNMPAIETLVQRHLEGFQDATDRIWRLLNLQIWGDVFLTGRRERRLQGLIAPEN
jgi:asparagine synthase (glutamine-hydrolysing)